MSQLLEVTLSECLEVKDAALNEMDLWAILTQTLERIEALFSRGNITKPIALLPITPDSLLLCANGQSELTSANKNSKYHHDCMPPEFHDNVLFNTEQYEKMFIFSLGMSIYIAADYNLTSEEDLNISSELDELLSSMCLKNPTSRINLNGALKACSGNLMSITPIIELHRMVLGQTDIEMHPVEEREYNYSYETFKPDNLSHRSETSTIHYILLDRSLGRSTVRSVETFYNQSKATHEHVSLQNEGDIDETFSRLNNRRMRLESLRKGLIRTDHDDYSSARLSHYGPLNTNRSTLNSMATVDRQPMDFLSTEYEWLNKRAMEIDDWRKNYLKTKEMIITPDPLVRKTDMTPQYVTSQTEEVKRQQHPIQREPSMDRIVLNRNNNVPLKNSMATDFNVAENQSEPIQREPSMDRIVLNRNNNVPPKNSMATDFNVAENQSEIKLGPEFRRSYPTVNLMVREASLITESNIRHAKIRLLDGSEVDVICCPSNTGQQLHECISAFLLLKEPHLFGLAVQKEEELHFLNKELELRKVAPFDWSDKKKFRNKQSSFLLLYFCVQYFVPSLNYLRYSSTLHLFYLQLRQHLLSDRLQINKTHGKPTYYLMAALALQAEFSIFNEHSSMEFDNQDYLPPRILRESGGDGCRSLILSKWRGISNVSPQEAERTFVETCLNFHDYGFHFYRVSEVDDVFIRYFNFDLSNIINISSPNNTWIGVGLKGLMVGKNSGESRLLEILHPWDHTMKVSYNRHRFSISKNNHKYNYYTNSYRKCRYLLWLSSDQHSFKMFPRIPNFDRPLSDNIFQSNVNTRNNGQIVGPEIKIPKLNVSPSDDSENYIQLRTQNKLLNYLQEDPQVNRQSKDNFDEVIRFRPNVSQENKDKSTEVQLPTFNFDETNKSHQMDAEMFTKRERSTDQLSQKSNLFNNDNTEDHHEDNQTENVSPPAFKSNLRSLKPPMKAPRQFKSSTVDTSGRSTPEVTKGDDVNNIIPLISSHDFSGVKLNPIFQDQSILVDKFEDMKEVTKDEEIGASFHLEKHLEDDPNESLTQKMMDKSVSSRTLASNSSIEPSTTVNLKPVISHERIKLTLEKIPPGGYGIGLARDRKHEGVFIISLLPGGVADMDGRLLPGDEIKSVNGEDVSGSNGYPRVIELLSQNTAMLEVERKILSENSANENPNKSSTENSEPNIPNVLNRNDSSHSLSNISNASHSPKEFLRNISRKPDSISLTSTNLNKNNKNNNNNNNNEDLNEMNTSSEHTRLTGCHDEGVDDIAGNVKFEINNEDGEPPHSFEIQRTLKSITDMLLLSSLDEIFVDSHENYKGEELNELIKKLEVRSRQDQPLIDFKSLVHPRKNDPCLEGSKPVNRIRNRYQNVLPFDNSRVILESIHNSPSTQNNYINASHIKYTVGRKMLTFIATQAPLKSTIADFWLMVWQKNVKFIAMLTQEIENGQNKCCRYWPDHELIIFDRLKIMLKESRQVEDFDVKIFLMVDSESDEHKVVCHSSFRNWPQESLRKQDTANIIKFLSLMDRFSNEGPAVIHCSAGIGRTGVLVASQIFMEFLRQDMRFDLKKIIENIREQRGGFIQTRQQYQLCCKIMLDALKLLKSSQQQQQ